MDTPQKIVNDLERTLADFESDDDDEMLKASTRIQILIDAAREEGRREEKEQAAENCAAILREYGILKPIG